MYLTNVHPIFEIIFKFLLLCYFSILYVNFALHPGTYVEYLVLTSGGIFDGNQKAFVSDLAPGELFTEADISLAGFAGMVDQMMKFAERMYKLELSDKEKATLYAICLLTSGIMSVTSSYIPIKILEVGE